MICRHDTPVLWLSLLLLAAGVAWPSRAALALPVSTARAMTTVSVTRVVTGDTIEVELDGLREQVRYLGIVAPGDGSKPEAKAALGQTALEANHQLVAGQLVQLEFGAQPRDAQGRLLAYVYVGERMVNAELVQRGYARVVTMLPNVRYQARLLALQWEAREAGRGLWAQSMPEPARTDAVLTLFDPEDLPREAQVRLRAAGFDPGPPDGVLGPRTSAALRQYQAARALAETGALDQETLTALGIQVNPQTQDVPLPPLVAPLLNPLKERQKNLKKECVEIQKTKVEIDTVYEKAEKKHNENKEKNQEDDKDIAQMIEVLPSLSKNFEESYNMCNETLQYARTSINNMQEMVKKFSSETNTTTTSESGFNVKILTSGAMQDLIRTLRDAIREFVQHMETRVSEYKNRKLAGANDLERLLKRGRSL